MGDSSLVNESTLTFISLYKIRNIFCIFTFRKTKRSRFGHTKMSSLLMSTLASCRGSMTTPWLKSRHEPRRLGVVNCTNRTSHVFKLTVNDQDQHRYFKLRLAKKHYSTRGGKILVSAGSFFLNGPFGSQIGRTKN